MRPSRPFWHLLLLAAAAAPAAAQPPAMPPQPVGYTEARHHALHRSVRLSGSVEARRVSVVAAEVAGIVVELAAREGDLVTKGKPLVKLRQVDLELQRAARGAELKEAEARLGLATRTVERTRELFASEVVSRERLDDAASEEVAWQGRVESLKAELARIEDGLARSTVGAPFTGVVVREHTQVGQWLTVGGPVVELVDLEELEVVLDLPERYFAGLEEGAPARVAFEALPGVEIAGRISAVIPRAAAETRTFPVKVRFANRGHRVGVGMLAQVELGAGETYRALVVPKDAVVRQGEQSVVHRIGAGNQVEVVPVSTGGASGGWIEVAGGLAAGDRVVTRGNERLFPGQAVVPTAVAYPLPSEAQ